jgi:hypothetical protein
MSSTPGYFSYPFPVFQPSMRLIAAITNANPAVVTTTINHQYITGTIVRLDIPPSFGMQQANQLTGTIIVTGNTTFTINIDTTQFAPYIAPTLPVPLLNSYGQCVPIGETADILTAAVQNVLPYSAS